MNLAEQWDDKFEEKLHGYLKTHLPELILKNPPQYEIELRERIVRVEEALKNQNEFLKKMLEFIEKRFDQVDKRFEQADKRMDSFERRLEKLDHRMWTIAILVLASVLIPIILKVFFK